MKRFFFHSHVMFALIAAAIFGLMFFSAMLFFRPDSSAALAVDLCAGKEMSKVETQETSHPAPLPATIRILAISNGISVFLDEQTGIQYIASSRGGIIVRAGIPAPRDQER